MTRARQCRAGGMLALVLLAGPTVVAAQPAICNDIGAQLPGGLPDLATALADVITEGPGGNGGLPTDQWAAIVDRDGRVCTVVFSGADRASQWPGSRVIAMQKAHTGNAFSLDGLALSTANLWASTQPGGSLFGLQFSNPVDPLTAYHGPIEDYGAGSADPAVGQRVGGVNVFGGGLALYSADGQVIGGLGTSGNTSCADHIIGWKVRDRLGLDTVPGGVSDTGDDNMVFDVPPGQGAGSRGGFGHPECGFGERPIAEALPQSHPIGVDDSMAQSRR